MFELNEWLERIGLNYRIWFNTEVPEGDPLRLAVAALVRYFPNMLPQARAGGYTYYFAVADATITIEQPDPWKAEYMAHFAVGNQPAHARWMISDGVCYILPAKSR